jgi:hypothetical protein
MLAHDVTSFNLLPLNDITIEQVALRIASALPSMELGVGPFTSLEEFVQELRDEVLHLVELNGQQDRALKKLRREFRGRLDLVPVWNRDELLVVLKMIAPYAVRT